MSVSLSRASLFQRQDQCAGSRYSWFVIGSRKVHNRRQVVRLGKFTRIPVSKSASSAGNTGEEFGSPCKGRSRVRLLLISFDSNYSLPTLGADIRRARRVEIISIFILCPTPRETLIGASRAGLRPYPGVSAIAASTRAAGARRLGSMPSKAGSTARRETTLNQDMVTICQSGEFWPTIRNALCGPSKDELLSQN